MFMVTKQPLVKFRLVVRVAPDFPDKHPENFGPVHHKPRW